MNEEILSFFLSFFLFIKEDLRRLPRRRNECLFLRARMRDVFFYGVCRVTFRILDDVGFPCRSIFLSLLSGTVGEVGRKAGRKALRLYRDTRCYPSTCLSIYPSVCTLEGWCPALR